MSLNAIDYTPKNRNPSEMIAGHSISFDVEVARSLGIEHAIILSNCKDIQSNSKEDLHNLFPYIEKRKFYKTLKELVSLGLIEVNA